MSLVKIDAAVRLLSLAWSAALIGLMATGTFSPARIGTMTWRPGHDIWSAAIAISQINFGLSGKLAYREIEQAIAIEVNSRPACFRDSGERDPLSLLGRRNCKSNLLEDALRR
jgi:hypothetical protein